MSVVTAEVELSVLDALAACSPSSRNTMRVHYRRGVFVSGLRTERAPEFAME